MARSKNIIPYRKTSLFNIGTIFAGAILLYLLITVLAVVTKKNVLSYEVTQDSISGNYRFTALSLKNEQIVTANYSGYVTYYSMGGSRIGAGMPVCAITDLLETASSGQGGSIPEDLDLKLLKSDISSFSLRYNDNYFRDVYNLRSDLEGQLSQSWNHYYSSGVLATQITPDRPGFVSYTLDGYEDKGEKDLSPELFNKTNYSTENLRSSGKVNMGDKLFKITEGEDWYLYFPIPYDMVISLQDRSSVRFRFLKDNCTFSAGFDILTSGDEYYGKITLQNSLVRYVNERFLDIELLMDSKKGLKVPTSAVSQRSFWKIPQEYAIENTSSAKEITLLKESFRNDGSSTEVYITARVYENKDHCYYVDENLFVPGDYVKLPDSAKNHQIVEEDLASIQGVFNINKGYAVFREVTIIDENEAFCIVEPYSIYGLAPHDYIAMDASTVSEDQIL